MKTNISYQLTLISKIALICYVLVYSTHPIDFNRKFSKITIVKIELSSCKIKVIHHHTKSIYLNISTYYEDIGIFDKIRFINNFLIGFEQSKNEKTKESTNHANTKRTTITTTTK